MQRVFHSLIPAGVWEYLLIYQGDLINSRIHQCLLFTGYYWKYWKGNIFIWNKINGFLSLSANASHKRQFQKLHLMEVQYFPFIGSWEECQWYLNGGIFMVCGNGMREYLTDSLSILLERSILKLPVYAKHYLAYGYMAIW